MSFVSWLSKISFFQTYHLSILSVFLLLRILLIQCQQVISCISLFVTPKITPSMDIQNTYTLRGDKLL